MGLNAHAEQLISQTSILLILLFVRSHQRLPLCPVHVWSDSAHLKLCERPYDANSDSMRQLLHKACSDAGWDGVWFDRSSICSAIDPVKVARRFFLENPATSSSTFRDPQAATSTKRRRRESPARNECSGDCRGGPPT